jgi:hypothetical protein
VDGPYQHYAVSFNEGALLPGGLVIKKQANAEHHESLSHPAEVNDQLGHERLCLRSGG